MHPFFNRSVEGLEQRWERIGRDFDIYEALQREANRQQVSMAIPKIIAENLEPEMKIIEDAKFRRHFGLSLTDHAEMPAHDETVLRRWMAINNG